MAQRSWSMVAVAAALLTGVPSRGQAPTAAGGPPVQAPAARAARLAAQAEAAQAARKPAEAAKLLQQAAELTPDDWALWDRAGWAHLDSGQPAPALSAFEKARAAAPRGAAAPGGLIIASFALGKKAETLDLVKQSAAPELAAQMETVVSRGLAARQFTLDWNFALGALYATVIRNSGRALAPLEAVVRANPNHAPAWLLLVEVNQDLDRGAQQDAAAVRYLQLAPETPDAFRLKAERHAAQQQLAEAIEEYQAGILKHPTAADLYYPLARVFERVGRPDRAEETYRKLVTVAEQRKLEATLIQARTQLANFHARRRKYPEAEAFYRQAAARGDAPTGVVETWAALLALTGRWEEAARAFDTAVERGRAQNTETSGEALLTGRFRAALCRLAAGQREAARSSLEAAVAAAGKERTTGAVEAAAFLAWLGGKPMETDPLAYRRGDERWAAFIWRRTPPDGEFEVRGRFSTAAVAWRAILQQVQSRHSDCWPAEYALARIQATGGYSQEAVGLLTRVARARPGWWASYYALGQYYAAERDRDNGLPALRKVLELAPECRAARSYLSLLSGVRSGDDE